MRKLIFSSLSLVSLLASAVLALPSPIGENEVHVVTDTDTIYSISRQYGLAPDHVLWANDMSLNRPPEVGDELLIPLRRIPPFTPEESTAIVLNLPERMLYLFRDGKVANYWGVAIGGAQYPTPDGTFRILDKEENPTWDPPAWLERESVGPGPDNPLGDRWMQITPNMVGIHGTNNPDSIGGVASLGCVRLYPEAIRELYEQVSVGTPVYSIYEQVRLAKDTDGTVVWSFFPDPYTKYYSSFQAREGVEQAQAEGYQLDISDFEIKERTKCPNGLITPVYGMPLKVKAALPSDKVVALRKPTGDWLSASVLETRGFEIVRTPVMTTITSPKGLQLHVSHEELPLNPHRIDKELIYDVLTLEGHSWRGETWLPFPMVLDYFEIPYEWDKRKGVLTLGAPSETSLSVGDSNT